MTAMAWIQSHRRSILFLLSLISIGGLTAAFHLPVSMFPAVDFPRVVVHLDAGDRPAEQMALQVTTPVEAAIRGVPGVQDVRSTTSRGSADVEARFAWGTDMPAAALQVNAAVAQILPVLPAGTTLETHRMTPTVYPIIAYSLVSDTVSLARLRDIAEYEIRPLLLGIDGVARVRVQGGAVAEYQVIADPARLQAVGLSMGDVARALSAANVLAAVGRLEDHYKLYLVVSDDRFRRLAQIGDTVLRSDARGVVRVKDIARVRLGVAPMWQRVTADGHDAVLFSIYQQPDGNSVQIAADVRARLAAFRSTLPPGVRITNWYDQSRLVVASATSVRDAILIGVVLAAAVLWLFLRNAKVMVIALLVVPAALAATVVLLQLLGMSFNIMTLGGMAAAVGLIVDDAIVMVEHIMRRQRESDLPHQERVMGAAQEFLRPLAGSSAATLVIFVPLAFLSGVTGAFFKALSATMASGLLLSFCITWLAVPILADRWLTEADAESAEREGRLIAWFHRRYEALLTALFARPLWLLAGIAPLLLGGWLAYHAIGSGFMPAMDEGGFTLDYRSKPGTSLTETDRLLRQLEAIISSDPNVASYSRRTGAQLGGDVTEANEGDLFVRLKSGPRAPIDVVMEEIRRRIEAQVPGLEIETAQLMEDMIGDLTAVPQPIEVKIFSDEPAKLFAAAHAAAALLGRIPGVVEIKDGINPAGDAIEIHVDRHRAAREGMDPDSVTRAVAAQVQGTVVTQIERPPKMVGLRLWTSAKLRDTDAKLADLLLRAPDGHLFPLRRVARFVAVQGQPQIDRENLRRMVAVTARLEGRDMGSAAAAVQRALDAPGALPAGVVYEMGGMYQQQQIAFRGLMIVLGAAVALVFLLLLFLYERFRIAFAILATPLLCISAVFVGLWTAGLELNISALMGMTMIVGIATEVAIFYFSEFQGLAGTALDGPGLADATVRRQALVQAGKNRMRPIAMTTAAAILTLLPLAFAIGQGSAMQQPLAVAIVSGLLVQLPVTLLVMPVLFDRMQPRSAAGRS
ncbi:acriflavin resistance protein [Burkholderiales bacterium GJ-E10]|nr:acriflavin resistance protein [Burkholderiales bacterium GJ-E10]